MEPKSRHFESLYLILTDTGSLIMQSYRPTDKYSGQKASDLSALWEVPYLKTLSHEMQVGEEVTIFRNLPNAAHPVEQAGVIVAKLQRYWNYSKPMGQREEVMSVSLEWNENMKYYHNQYK